MTGPIHPLPNDREELKQLWCELFPEDADGWCELYFEHMYAPERCYVLRNETAIETVIHIIDGYYMDMDGTKKKLAYLFAVGTRERYRGKDNLRRMLGQLRDILPVEGYSCMSCISLEELIGLYDSAGALRLPVLYRYEPEPAQPRSGFRLCGFDDYLRLRRKFLDETCGVWFDDKTERFMFDDVCRCGAVLMCGKPGEEQYAVCIKSGDDMIVPETTAEDRAGLADELIRRFSPRGSVIIYSRTSVTDGDYREIYYGHIIACKNADERVSSLYINPLTL